MFILNLTVSEGTIIPFTLYFNILNIHNISLFPSHSLIKPFYTFTSFVNFNLGIETCFYNGMDDYTKTWLQSSFPNYLIMIITSIIIATHHSIVLQRLTLHKTVPVLATILLLSYTKILQTTSNVLFLYSTITDYPSNVSSVVWSIDANVPLFGLRHSVLFTFGILMLLLITLYTCFLLFGKYLNSNLNLLILYSTSLMLSEDQSICIVVVNTMVGCGVVQFILMIVINCFSFKCYKINVIKCLKLEIIR